MTESVLFAIAFLCQIHNGGAVSYTLVEQAQARCHAYYAACLSEAGNDMLKCMRDRK
jgi:hypothetical protein